MACNDRSIVLYILEKVTRLAWRASGPNEGPGSGAIGLGRRAAAGQSRLERDRGDIRTCEQCCTHASLAARSTGSYSCSTGDYSHRTERFRLADTRLRHSNCSSTRIRFAFALGRIMIPLRCCVKKYDWGKKGTDSIVARIVKSQMPSYEVDSDTPFAELWMGTHPSGPSVVMGTGPNHNNVTLLNCLSTYPEYVGNIKIVAKYGRNLPFLFKVLSVRTALSIQAHPNKALAESLHHDDPFHYPDANHKPELAIALTEFEAFCGFRPHSEVEFLLNNVSEFKNTVGAEASAKYFAASDKKQSLKELFSALMTAPEELVKSNLSQLKGRWSAQEEANPQLETLRKLFLKLTGDFPEDIGLFAIFLLNYLVLQPGEAIYLGQDEPHAYILGDCMECMACSDNVVRAGLTPKFKDVKTLCDMLTYNSRSPSDQCLNPITVDKFTRSYIVPVPEFVVDAIEVKQEDIVASFEYKLEAKESGSILIAIRGDATVQDDKLFAGYVGFIPASTSLLITNVKSPLLLYRAYCRLNENDS